MHPSVNEKAIQTWKMDHLAGEGIHQEALASGFLVFLGMPAWSSQEPTIRTSSPTTSRDIGARRAAVSVPSEVKQENLNLGSTSTGSGAGRA
jgi:hypothetical protein